MAKTTLYNSIKETKTPPVIYVPYTQVLAHLGGVHFELRTAGDAVILVNAVRQATLGASAVGSCIGDRLRSSLEGITNRPDGSVAARIGGLFNDRDAFSTGHQGALAAWAVSSFPC